MNRKGLKHVVVVGSLFIVALAVLVYEKSKPNSSASKQEQNKTLYFRKNSSFSILQIADIHLGENSWTDWGPEQDVKTFRALDRIILDHYNENQEKNDAPDLIVLSGDQLTANNVNANATTYYEQLGNHLEQYQIPWVFVFGNHDDMPFLDPWKNQTEYPAKTSRKQLLETMQRFPHCLTYHGSPPSVFGVSNFWLPIVNEETADVEAFLLFLDTGGGSLPQQIDATQLDWIQDSSPKENVPIFAFQHIPTFEFQYLEDRCQGLHDDGVSALPNTTIVQTLANMSTFFLAVGHDHGSSYCCQWSNSRMHLCFGRHSGYGGYGHWERGSRVYRIERGDDNDMTWSSWVQLESGIIVDEYRPDDH